MLTLANVHSYYGRSHILHDVSFSVPKGSILAVMGRNGMGKSTLLKTILGLTDHQSGEIYLDGRNISRLPTHLRARSGIAYVPQGRGILPELTVGENILLGTFARRRPGKNGVPEIVGELFPYLSDNLGRLGGLLSGGQQQQLALARALAAEPDVLLLDEPTEGIQPNIVVDIENFIADINRIHGKTVILVEQNIDFIRRAAHNIVVLEKGSVLLSGDIHVITDNVIERCLLI